MKRSVLSIATLLFLFVAPLSGQQRAAWDATRAYLTRPDLEQMLKRYELSAESQGYSDELRRQASTEADRIRARLREGDFQVGDYVALRVEAMPQLSDTFPVRSGRTVVLPQVGEVSLQGVLRSETQTYLTEQIARTIRNPAVRVQSLVRVSVMGEVGRPGFYVVATESVLSDVLMQAGGPAPTARLAELRIERGTAPLWEGDALQQALAEGLTVDDLGLRAGDRIFVPAARRRDAETFRMALVTIPTFLMLIRQFF